MIKSNLYLTCINLFTQTFFILLYFWWSKKILMIDVEWNLFIITLLYEIKGYNYHQLHLTQLVSANFYREGFIFFVLMINKIMSSKASVVFVYFLSCHQDLEKSSVFSSSCLLRHFYMSSASCVTAWSCRHIFNVFMPPKALHASANSTNSNKSAMIQWKIRHDFMVLTKIELTSGRGRHEKLKGRTKQF